MDHEQDPMMIPHAGDPSSEVLSMGTSGDQNQGNESDHLKHGEKPKGRSKRRSRDKPTGGASQLGGDRMVDIGELSRMIGKSLRTGISNPLAARVAAKFSGKDITTFLQAYESEMTDFFASDSKDLTIWFPEYCITSIKNEMRYELEGLPWPAAKKHLLKRYRHMDSDVPENAYKELDQLIRQKPRDADACYSFLAKHKALVSKIEGSNWGNTVAHSRSLAQCMPDQVAKAVVRRSGTEYIALLAMPYSKVHNIFCDIVELEHQLYRSREFGGLSADYTSLTFLSQRRNSTPPPEPIRAEKRTVQFSSDPKVEAMDEKIDDLFELMNKLTIQLATQKGDMLRALGNLLIASTAKSDQNTSLEDELSVNSSMILSQNASQPFDPMSQRTVLKREKRCHYCGDTSGIPLSAEGDITGRPNFKPMADRGSSFIPMQPEQHSPRITPLPASPVDLFHEFVPESLVEKWVIYMNEAPEPARGPEPGSRNNSNYKSELSWRGKAWNPTSVPEVYLWLAIQIYLGLHRETELRDYWKTSGPDSNIPTYPIIKYMTFDRFQLLSWRLRTSPYHIIP
ncbi:hypothetical protein S40285_09013 [Stachybotrys chlorohalonatus IBT 40285]|uniref:PiggyBac transposable element-derived protein domain-containing protein n=1 Tax=Stachybotrys chlorohalonatus (strain IBT 40285) TaxID=1283841 RepID=A0A084QVQ2_STAC4|nr:hypothetical protein S40285_09013 [Stachybotrys chlorohalonata IBT 40285]